MDLDVSSDLSSLENRGPWNERGRDERREEKKKSG